MTYVDIELRYSTNTSLLVMNNHCEYQSRADNTHRNILGLLQS